MKEYLKSDFDIFNAMATEQIFFCFLFFLQNEP